MADVVIVGGGPAGLNAALLLGRARRDVVLVDAGNGRNKPSQHAHNLLTRDGIAPGELREAARRDIAQYPTVSLQDNNVAAISGSRGEFVLDLQDGGPIAARRVLLATGVVDELPDVPGLAALWGVSVLHCPYCHGYEVRDQPLAVLVTNFFGVTTAVRLASGFSQDVVACAPAGYTMDDMQRGMLDAAGVKVVDVPVERFEGEAGDLRRVVFADGSELDRTAVFLHPDKRQGSPLAQRLGCTLLDDGLVEVNDMQQTSVSGVFAAGDLARRAAMPFGREQVATAAAEGLTAAVFIDQELTFMG